ncbi:hypothetical protein AB205_0030930, partial [Aquarana catesbeiana]
GFKSNLLGSSGVFFRLQTSPPGPLRYLLPALLLAGARDSGVTPPYDARVPAHDGTVTSQGGGVTAYMNGCAARTQHSSRRVCRVNIGRREEGTRQRQQTGPPLAKELEEDSEGAREKRPNTGRRGWKKTPEVGRGPRSQKKTLKLPNKLLLKPVYCVFFIDTFFP